MQNNNPHPHGNEKFPASFWYFLIVLTLVVGGIVWQCTKQKTYPVKKNIDQRIGTVKQKRSEIIQQTRKESAIAKHKGDSLIQVLKKEPWKLEEKDLEDSIVREYLRNYHAQP